MIYAAPVIGDPIDQGDILDDCPAVRVKNFDPIDDSTPSLGWDLLRAYVLTQTCDLAQRKTDRVSVAVVLDATRLIAEGELKAADVRGPIRAGRVFGWYFLPRSHNFGLPES